MSLCAGADTRTAIWYVFGDASVAGRTGSNRGRRIVGDRIGISSITFSEIIYLQERRQVDPATLAPFRELTAVMERVLGSDDCHEAGREHLDPVD